MQVKPRSYPHPVLADFGDDIVDSQFQVTVAAKGTKTAYVVQVTAKTSNTDLVNLVKAGRARYAVHLECPVTRYRALFVSNDETFDFQIPGASVDGRVEVCSFIIAAEDIADYKNDAFHPDYGGMSFNIRKGDTLAVAPDQFFLADKHLDPLRKIPSIFVVVVNDSPDAPPIDIDLTSQKIRISLSRENHEVYKFLRNAQPLHTTLTSTIIVPALVFTLDTIRQAATGKEGGLATYEDLRWYAVLLRRLKDLGISPAQPETFDKKSTLKLAQDLIGTPLTDSLKTLRSYEDTTD